MPSRRRQISATEAAVAASNTKLGEACRALDEQLNGFETGEHVGRVVLARKFERGHPPGDLAGMPERLAARDHNDEIRATGQQPGGQRDDGVEDVLAVVENEQDRAAGELVDECRDPWPTPLERQPERPTHRRRDAVTVRHPGQLHQPHPVRPARRRQLTMRKLDGQAGLARTARTGEGEQARPLQQLAQLGQFPAATDEARRQRRQVVRAHPRIRGATDEQPPVHGGRLGSGTDAIGLGEPIAQALEGRRCVPASPGCGHRNKQRPVQTLVERALHHQRLEQRERFVATAACRHGTSQVSDQPGSNAFSRSRCGAAQSS